MNYAILLIGCIEQKYVFCCLIRYVTFPTGTTAHDALFPFFPHGPPTNFSNLYIFTDVYAKKIYCNIL